MKNILSILYFILLSVSVSAQSRVKKADDLYNLKSYWSAAVQYERLVGSDHDTPQMKIRLANSYYFMGNYEKALEHYDGIDLSEYQKEDLYNYIQVTKMHGNYTRSNELLQHFCKNYDDERCSEYNQDPNYLTALQGKVHFTLKETTLSTENNEFGAYTFNGNDIYILSDKGSSGFINRKNLYNGKRFLDIYRVQKSENETYSKAKKVKGKVNSKLNEGPMFITPDGKRVYFTRNNTKAVNGIYHLSIYLADIDKKGKWVNVRGLSINSDHYSVGHPVLTKDGKKMVFSSTIEGGHGGADLYIADVTENGDVTNIQNMGNIINTPRNEFFPWINTDGNIYFTSDGHPGFGGLDNFVAVMAGDNVVKILNCGSNVNTPQDDFALTLSEDGKNGYVSSNRINGKGADDIYSVQLVNPFPRMITLTGKTTDLVSNETIGNVSIALNDAETGEIFEATSNENGEYFIYVPADSELELTAQKADYLPKTAKISTAGTNVAKDIALEEDLGNILYVRVFNKDTKESVQDAKVTIKDKSGKTIAFTGKTGEDGGFRQLLEGTKKGDQLDYRIKAEKSGYAPKEVSFNHLIAMSGEVYFAIDLDKLEIGKDLASMIALNPIYFDLNSSKVREDAKTELDKIVQVLNENPTMVIELGSHTDCRSSAKYNLTLSDKRAKASADYIRKRITQPSRVTGKGYGESRLLNDCACEGKIQSDCTEEEHAINRRTEFRIIKF